MRIAALHSNGTTPLPSSPSPSAASSLQAQHAGDDDFADLTSDAFDDYEPSPTVHEPGPSVVPSNLRTSVVHSTTVLKDSQTSSLSTSSTPTPPTGPDKMAAPDTTEEILDTTSPMEDNGIMRAALQSSREEPSNGTGSSTIEKREPLRPSQLSDICRLLSLRS